MDLKPYGSVFYLVVVHCIEWDLHVLFDYRSGWVSVLISKRNAHYLCCVETDSENKPRTSCNFVMSQLYNHCPLPLLCSPLLLDHSQTRQPVSGETQSRLADLLFAVYCCFVCTGSWLPCVERCYINKLLLRLWYCCPDSSASITVCCDTRLVVCLSWSCRNFAWAAQAAAKLEVKVKVVFCLVISPLRLSSLNLF